MCAFVSLCKALWGCSIGGTIGMQGTGWPALTRGWLLWMQFPMLWSAWKKQKRFSPGGTAVPEGERNGSLLEELQVLMGNLVILLLFLYIELTQQVPGLLCFHIQTSTSIPELSKSKNKENNPCEIVESYFSRDLSSAYPITAAFSITFPVTRSHSCLHNFPAVPELPPTPLCHLLSNWQPILWLSLNYTYANWLAGRPNQKGERDAQCWWIFLLTIHRVLPILRTRPSEISACSKRASNWPASLKAVRKKVGTDRWTGRQNMHMFYFLQVFF